LSLPHRILPFLLLAVYPFCLASASAAEEEKPSPALGLILESGALDTVQFLPVANPERPVYVRLQASRENVERRQAIYDWSEYSPAISALRGKGYRIVLSLTEPDHPAPPVVWSQPDWISFVRSSVRSFAGEIEILEIASKNTTPVSYAFALKESAIAARAEARAMGATIRIAQAPVDVDSLEWQKEIWSADSAAYIDILPLEIAATTTPEELSGAIEALAAESLLHPPASQLWAYSPVGGAWEGVEQAVRSLSFGVEVALVTLGGASEVAAWISTADSALGEGYAPAPIAGIRLADDTGVPLGRFFSGEDFSTLVFYSLRGEFDSLPSRRMLVDSRYVRNARILDPLSGRTVRVGSAPAGEQGAGSVIRVSAAGNPLILFYEKGIAPQGLELPPEEIETVRGRDLTAEEIIARHQQVQKIQDDALERWMARARIDFHFKLAQSGGTIDVSIDSNHFWERGGYEEWEQTGYYLNGNKVTWKSIPELPFFQPEKVITLPLDLTLDKTYVYRSADRGRVGERDAYVLEFEPADPESPRSLYRGRVWIDRDSFVRLKISVRQTNLESPVLSNDENDTYREEIGPGGESFWLLDDIDGQQVWSIGGRNFIVRREVHFLTYEINPPIQEFNERREEAYSSKNQMLRDTGKGLRYLERQPDGSRSVKEGMDTSQLLAGFGAFKDNSIDGVAPLGGVDYFNADLFGKNIQLNVLYGGVLAFVTASKPDLFGKKSDTAGDLTAIAIKLDGKVYSEGVEVEPERIRQRAQHLSARLGFPAGPFFKFSLIGGLTQQSYFQDDDNPALYEANFVPGVLDLEFILPQDHLLYSGAVLAEFNRRGWAVALSGSLARRSKWEQWGLYNNARGTFARIGNDYSAASYEEIDPEPVHNSFAKWSAVAFKEWYLPNFQELRLEIDYLYGTDLDRFSRFGFSRFGASNLSGFSGSGVRFDRGSILRGSYAFNILEAVSLKAVLESARVEHRGLREGYESHTGFGLSADFIGPWKTIVAVSMGYAVNSDVPDLEGEMEYFLFIFKLF
jgi:hypothetical protein